MTMRSVIAIALLCCAGSATAQPALRFDPLPLIVVGAGADAGPQAMTLADLDADGDLDLVMIDRDNEQVHVLLNDGSGAFTVLVTYALEGLPTSVAVADISSPFASDFAGDIDGNLDLIVAHEDGFAEVLLGRGDGQFDPPEQDLSEVLDSAELLSVVTGDFNGDGYSDLALLDFFDEVYFLCNFNGVLGPCLTDVLETGGSDPVSLAIGDFDNDSFLDVAVLNAESFDISIMYGNGDGSFDPIERTVVAVGDYDQEPRHLVAVDFDDDPSDDLIVANYSDRTPASLVTVFGRPNRMPVRDGHIGLFGMTTVAAADFDGDDAVDAAMIVEDGLAGISINDGTGGFLTPVQPSGGPVRNGRAAVTGDLNGDDRDDLVVLDISGLAVQAYLNVPVCAGDCDGDGTVSIDELIRGVGIATGAQPAASCAAMDSSGNAAVEINELVAAVASALAGCSA